MLVTLLVCPRLEIILHSKDPFAEAEVLSLLLLKLSPSSSSF